MIKFSSGLLDKLVPYLSNLTECSMPDMSDHDPQSVYWVQNYLLTTTFKSKYPEPYHQIAMSYMRRAEATFREYDLARQSLISYLSGSREALSTYFTSLYHFEQLISQSHQAYLLMRHFLHNPTPDKEPRLFKVGDQSILDRLYKLYNYIKHCDDKLNSNKFPADGTLPIWLTNEGVCCCEAALTYQDFAEMLADIANGANRFGNPSAVIDLF